ncbi:hypothetical protein F5Y16DRAFT_405740 [Xylariaceae sp. FL0255]|nr:hypothetical protein F5Y16DRAFT_405740 [Xylariaceae sp. FL0255]
MRPLARVLVALPPAASSTIQNAATHTTQTVQEPVQYTTRNRLTARTRIMPTTGSRTSAIAVGFCFPILDGILVGLRFYARRYDKRDLHIDDWLCIPAWLFLTGCCGTLLTGLAKGVFAEAPGFHNPEDLTRQEQLLAKITAALVMLWLAANICIKLIILFFYRRIFVSRLFKIISTALIAMSAAWFLSVFIAWLLYCGTDFTANFGGGWAICPPWGIEIQIAPLVFDNLIDLCLLLLPIPFVWNLQLELKRKLCVIFIFILGGFAFVASLNNTSIQLVYLIQPEMAESVNFFQGSSLLFNWPVIEIGVGLLASSLPHISLRAAKSLQRALPSAVRISFNSLRNTASTIPSLCNAHEDEAAEPSYVAKVDRQRSLRLNLQSHDLTLEGTMSIDKTLTQDIEHYISEDFRDVFERYQTNV